MKGRSSATFFSDPVLLARKRCEHCHGSGNVATPEFAGWQATVEQIKSDLMAATGAREKPASDAARTKAGSHPNPSHTPCKCCKGRGYKKVEVPLHDLADLLAREQGAGDKAAA